MENNEKVAVEESQTVQVEETATPPANKKPSIGAKFKEFWRKQVVKLKKKTHTIPFFMLLVCCVFYLLSLNDLSKSSAVAFKSVPYLGISVFVNVLFSILVLVLFMNAFPKYPKVNKKTGKKSPINIPMLVLGFVFIVIMILFNVLYMLQLMSAANNNPSAFFESAEQAQKYSAYLKDDTLNNIVSGVTVLPDPATYKPYLIKSYNLSIAHIVLLGVTIILYATLPLYKKLIMKINTKKELEDNNIHEVIETEDE